MTRRLALAVGDTAGHVMPALAIAEAYSRLFTATDIRFFAAGQGAGHWLIQQAGFPVDYVPGSQIARTSRVNQVLALARAAAGTVRARTLLRTYRTRLVIGTGGYGSAAAMLAARSLGLGTTLVELNVVPGLTNRLLGRIAERACVAFDEAARRFPAHRAIVTGIPIRQAVADVDGIRRAPSFPHTRLLVMSGSRGEDFLGTQMPDVCEALTRIGLVVDVRHQGGLTTDSVRTAYERRGIRAQVEPFIDDMAGALAWADVAIARAGAGTIAELSAAGVPALLIPLADAAHDHQSFNAKAAVARGAAWMMREQEWSTTFAADLIAGAIRDAHTWTAMSGAMKRFTQREAAARVVRACEDLMERRW